MFNEVSLPHSELYTHEDDVLGNYEIDQCVIIKKSNLPLITGIDYTEETPEPLPPNIEWYPYVNSYYPYTEDVDAFARVNHLLANRPLCSFTSLSSVEFLNNFEESGKSWEQIAQLNYLQSNPVCFIIFGKPGIGEQDLGKQLANYWQCCYIDPEILIQQEIEIGSRAGECIEFNLRCGRAIGIDVILKLLEKRVKSQTAQHRGFVICGFPVIPNDLYEEDPVSSESAIFNVREIFEEIFETTIQIGIPPSKPHVSISSKAKTEGEDDESDVELELKHEVMEDEEEQKPIEEEETEKDVDPPPTIPEPTLPIPVDLGSAIYDVGAAPEIGTNYEEQLNFLFSLLKKPLLMIYITCSTPDVINKRNDYRFDIYSNLQIDLQMESLTKTVHSFFESGMFPGDMIEEFFDPNYFYTDSTRLRHLVKLPRNFPANVSTQLDRYHCCALNLIEEKVLLHDPQYFIKVDGRTSPMRMFYIIKSRLRLLPLQQVILPQKINIQDDVLQGEGADTNVVFNMDGLTLEECFREISRKNVVTPMFKWTLSDWGTKCPVSLREGAFIDGDPNFAVCFMNKLFFLANQEAYFKFNKNPRPYLLPPFPRSTCQIYVFGPKLSGKTSIAQCLAYILNGTALHPMRIIAKYANHKKNLYMDKQKQNAMLEALTILNEQRRAEAMDLETVRQENIKLWLEEVQTKITEFLIKNDSQFSIKISSFPMPLKVKQEAVSLTEEQLALVNLGIPLDKITKEPLIWLQEHEDKLLLYLPQNLKQKPVAVPAKIFDEFVVNYVKEATENLEIEIDVNDEDLRDMFINAMKEAQEKYLERGQHGGGWVIDGMPCDVNLLQKLDPEFIANEVIVLKDTEDFEFLLSRFNDFDKHILQDFRNFFISIGNMDAAWRSPSTTTTQSYKTKMVENILNEILEGDNFKDQSIDEETELEETRFEKYKKALHTFSKQWSKVEAFFVSRNITPIEFSVTNKPISELLKEIIKVMENRYRLSASELTEEDRAEEVKNLGEQTVQDEEIGEGDEILKSPDDLFEQNRRYGDTYHFCPITFTDNWVLWKGKEDCAAKFENKIYLLSSAADLEKFIKSPRDYLPKTPCKIPPLRICIVGVGGTKTSAISKALADNLGVHHINFELALKQNFGIIGDDSLDEIRRNKDFSGTELQKYLKEDKPLNPKILENLIGQLFLDEFIKYDGFVINDFPRRPSDVAFMVEHKTIPDLIIQLVPPDELAFRTDLLEQKLKVWQEKTNEELDLLKEKQKQEIDFREKKRKERFQELLDQKVESRYAEKAQLLPAEDEENTIEIDTVITSQVSFDSVAEQEDIEQVKKILDKEMPEISFHEIDLETMTKDKRVKLEAEIEDTCEVESKFLADIKEACILEEMAWNDIELRTNEGNAVTQVFIAADKIKFRNNSLFERCYEVSMEVAERLLSCGYFFLSKFGRICPVQYYEKQNPIPMFLPLEQKFSIHPIIHRHYIYFVGGSDSLKKFKQDCLKYICVDSVNFPLIPFRVAITGPPKCGKTVLAERFNSYFGFKIVSRGSAARYVLGYLPFSELAKNMENVLRRGWELTDEMVVKSVQAACFDSRVVTQGVVFDGFPNTLFEVRHMSYVALVPNLVIDLEANQMQILECLSRDTGKRGMRRYSHVFVKHLFNEWLVCAEYFRSWLDKQYQNLVKLTIEVSNWAVWRKAFDLTTAACVEMKHYYIYIVDDWPLRLSYLLVTPLEFLERQSSFKTYCPCCLHYNYIFKNGGDPPDRTGLIQYRKYFYWLCAEHVETFLKTPDCFIAPYNNHSLPTNFPIVVHLTEMPSNLFGNGMCVVCYSRHNYIKGSISFAVAFNNKIYIFDSLDCLNVFLKSPFIYLSEINYTAPPPYPSLNYRELPTLGMLEQYVAKQVVTTLNSVCRNRPVIPGLSISASALIGLGLYLKRINTEIAEEYKPFYERALELYEKRRKNLIIYLDNMKAVINPYIHYEEPLPKFAIPASKSTTTISSESTTKAMSKILDSILNNIDSD